MPYVKNTAIFLLSAITYLACFKLNSWMFSAEYAQGVNFIFLPAGVRLLAFLLFGVLGCSGIAMATIYLAWQETTGLVDLPGLLLIGAISGYAPWIAGWVFSKVVTVEVELIQMNGKQLLQLALLSSLISGSMMQVLRLSGAPVEEFLSTAFFMAVGDFVGILLTLYAVKLSIELAGRMWRFRV
jgi:hypothetical protein